jgi:hypothetical protein
MPGDHPIVVLTGFYLHRDVLEVFNRRWNVLRDDIQSSLGSDWVPPIHLRLMWGKTVKRRTRGRDNPYVDATFDDIKAWVSRAWGIVDTFVRAKRAGWYWTMASRDALAQGNVRFVSHPQFAAELEFIQRYKARLFREYHRTIMSPLLPLFAEALLWVNELMMTQPHGTKTDILVDSFPESHGLDVLETVHEIKRVGRLDGIGAVSRIENADEEPLVQAADLIGFCRFRNEMATLGHINHDIALARIGGKRRGQSISVANIRQRLTQRDRRQSQAESLTMHYAIARTHVAARDTAFAEEYLVTTEEFYARALDAIDRGQAGVSVLTPAALADPRMPKTPD